MADGATSRALPAVRVEDLLAGGFAIALAAYGGLRAVWTGVRLSETDFWDFSFILSPLSLLIFLAALRYALGGAGGSITGETATGVGAPLREIVRLFRDWLPFLAFLLFYEAFRTRLAQTFQGDDLDAALLAWDRRLFGETPAVWFDVVVTPALTNVMTLAYFLHLLLPPVVAFVWYRRRKSGFREFLLAVLLSGMMGSMGYVVVPGIGPAMAYPELFSEPLGGLLYAPITTLMDAARAPRDIFPSLHVGLSTIVLWYGAKLGRRWLWVLLPLVVGNWISTVYLRYHYLVDVLAGWAVAALAIWGAGWLLSREERWAGRRERPEEG